VTKLLRLQRRRFLILCVGIILAFAFSASAEPGTFAKPGAGRVRANVLFIGNSYTFKLAELFPKLAAAAGKKGRFESVTEGGLQLRAHLERGEAAKRIASAHWDFVVLQEQSQTPGFSEAQVKAVMDPAVAEFRRLCSAAGATPVLFCHWAKTDGDRQNYPNDTYEASRARLNATFARIGREQSIALAPVGESWDAVRRQHPDIALHAPDGSHPSLAGAYLTTCIFFTGVFGESPALLPAVPGIDDKTAAILRKASATAGRNFAPNP
jgi:hypothetical protein